MLKLSKLAIGSFLREVRPEAIGDRPEAIGVRPEAIGQYRQIDLLMILGTIGF
jgi:hypothetical protein